jgi:hypothetical protein
MDVHAEFALIQNLGVNQKVTTFALSKRDQLLSRFLNKRSKKNVVAGVDLDFKNILFDIDSCRTRSVQAYLPCVNTQNEILGYFVFALVLINKPQLDFNAIFIFFSSVKKSGINYYIEPGYSYTESAQ